MDEGGETPTDARYAIAEQLGRIADVLDKLGSIKGRRAKGGDPDQRGCLERLAADLPEAIGDLADAARMCAPRPPAPRPFLEEP